MKCGACKRSARRLRRALILSGPGAIRAGRVCAGCAKLGWLLVLGEEREPPARRPRAPSFKRRRDGSLVGSSAAPAAPSEFGACDKCEQPAIVQINRVPLCKDHMGETLRETRALADRLGRR